MPKKALVTPQEAATTCVCQKARMAARAITRTYDDALRPSALRSTQFTILVAASMAGGIPLSRLAAMLGLERTTLTRNLTAIEREGLVRVASVNGRTRNVLLTSRGAARLDQALPLWDRVQQELRRRLGEKEWSTMNHSLTKLAETA
ncbi:MAG TPA: MarR family winged helix-turn-helix transcriptional regulator [Chthoniobacterales bacterium]|nr:MarR family winged helix-turn-helix transcriptional regulator [Chthoniobacterales bacterium]